MSSILTVSELFAGYGKKEVVRDLNFELNEGELVTVLGHNGAGKTTLLRSVFGVLRPTQGKVTLGSVDITGRPPSANIADGLALVPQGHGIFASLTVSKNLELGAFLLNDRALLPQRLQTVFDLFPILAERRRQIGGTLSGGQQQMLAIGMALMMKPRVLALDEPSIGLAPQLVERVMESIKEVNTIYGTTILMVEQNLKHCLAISDRAIVLNRGAKVYDGDVGYLSDEKNLLQLF